MNAERIVVLGSANVDLVVRAPRQPAPGETVFGDAFETVPGGKGLNQAVAAARAQGAVEFVGMVGKDRFGDRLLELLEEEGIATGGVARADLPTGTAHITVDRHAQNGIVVVPGANAALSPRSLETIDTSRPGWLVTQLEVPLPTVAAALKWARQHRFRSVLTPAPVVPLDEALVRLVDLLVPNQLEACRLAGADTPEEAAVRLSRLSRDVIVTLGADGSLWAREGRIRHRQAALSVAAVDTTAAGDTYVGVLVSRLAEQASLPDAMRWAAAASALSVTRAGATSSMPVRGEIEVALSASADHAY